MSSPQAQRCTEILQAAFALHEHGRLEEARAMCERVLSSEPRHPQALTLLAAIAIETHQPQRALELARAAIDVDPRSVAAYLIGGDSQHALGQRQAAVESYDRAIALLPTLGEAHLHRGNVLYELEHPAAALNSYERAIACMPDNALAHAAAAIALSELGRYEAALASFDRAIALQPDSPELHLNRGNTLATLQRLEESLGCYARAITLRPDYALAHMNSGNVLGGLFRFSEALASFDRSLELDSECADAHYNRGNLLGMLKRIDEALASYARAVEIDPTHANAQFARSVLLLLRGDMRDGWRGLEWRWRGPCRQESRTFRQPLWLGEESLSGKVILLQSEQGLGDTLQFCRYVGKVAALGADVILEAPGELAGLLRSLEGVARLVTRGEQLPPFDYYCPLLSLPLAFKTELASVPNRVPYLRAPPEKTRYWQERLGKKRTLRVGLIWSGGFRPKYPGLWAVNARRNIPLEKLARFKDSPVEFFSLQKGQPAESELSRLLASGWAGLAMRNHAAELRDFSDTAALMEALDLVISVDTSSAHLAGALGKPVWLLNRFDTCWRWLLDRSDSPWYPTMTIYRQERPGDWDSVLTRVAIDLDRLVSSSLRASSQLS